MTDLARSMFGVHQIQERNEKILALPEERRPADERSSGNSTQAEEEENNARPD